MPVFKADALILRTYKLGESDRIVVFLTRDRGKKRGVAKGARRPRSRYVGALEPMTRAGVAYYEREQRDLVRLNYVEPVQSPLAASTAEAFGHVGYFAELIDEWAPEAHADERLFRLGASIVDAVAIGSPVDHLARYFEYWLLRLQGVYPALACAGCQAALAAGVGDATAGFRVRVPSLCARKRRHRPVVGVDALSGGVGDHSSGAAGVGAALDGRVPSAGNGPPAIDQSASGEGAEIGPGSS